MPTNVQTQGNTRMILNFGPHANFTLAYSSCSVRYTKIDCQ
jgi:hypothetical protein